MKKLFYLALISTAVFFSGCVMNKLDTSAKLIVLKDTKAGTGISIDVKTGEQWSSRMQAGPFIFNILPQAVFWIEDENGKLIETLYITGADFKKMRHAAKNDDGAVFYAECLPYWSSKVKTDGGLLPSKENPFPDTVTSATPMADFSLQTEISERPASFVLMAEFNKSDDVSTVYTEDRNDWAGQPSLIYRAVVDRSFSGDLLVMELAGHGGRLTDTPAVYTDLTGIDTALDQIQEIRVRF